MQMLQNSKQLQKIKKLSQLIKQKKVYHFCIQENVKQTDKKKSKYDDSFELSKNQINSILKKVEKKPEIMFKHEFKYQHNYEQDIKDQLKEIQKNSLLNKYKQEKEESTNFSSSSSFSSQFSSFKQNEENMQKENQENNNNIEIKNNENNKDLQTQVKYYKYGLPIPNLEPELVPLPDPWANPEDEIETINERVFARLRLNENSSYQQYELQLRNEFNVEEDMYGDTTDLEKVQEEQFKQIGLHQCQPRDLLENQDYMDRVRRCVTLNLNMPGVMENEHPHKFLKELRPVEDFRHTPIIPISDRQMKEFQDKVKAYHRKGFYFEIKKDSIYNGIFLTISCSIGFYLIKTALKREEDIGVNMERLRIARLQSQVA